MIKDKSTCRIKYKKKERVKTMTQKIKNDLNHVTIGGSYVGGNHVVMNSSHSEEKEKSKEKDNLKDRTIFLSYNWHDGEIANKIDCHLSNLPDITVKRDIRDIGAWKSIREFMKSIRQQDYAIFIVSDCYLKSKNCMFEVLEMMKEQEYKERIFPAVVEQGIYDPIVRANYIKYWEQEYKNLEDTIKEIDLANATELSEDLKRYKNIATSMGEFLKIVADMNNPNIQEVEIQIEKAIQNKQ